MATQLAPTELVIVTGAERDALTASDGQLVWNSDEERVERYGDGRWSALALDDDVNALVGALALSIGRTRSALRFLGVEPDAFDPDMH
jgi:hypothetical protein